MPTLRPLAGALAVLLVFSTAAAAQGQTPPSQPAVILGPAPNQDPSTPVPSTAGPRQAPRPPPLTIEQQRAEVRSQPVAMSSWERKPTDRELSEAYPPAAFDRERAGTVGMMCTVAPDFGLTDCSVRVEPDTTLEFGQAALSLAPLFRASPSVTLRTPRYSAVSETGETVMIGGEPISLVGAKVLVPVQFSFLTTQLVREGSVKLTNADIDAAGALSTPERAAIAASTLLEIGKRNLSSDGVRAALRDAMIETPAIRENFENFLYNVGEKTDTIRIDRLSSDLIVATRTNSSGVQVTRMMFDLANPGGSILGTRLSAPPVPMNAPLPLVSAPPSPTAQARPTRSTP